MGVRGLYHYCKVFLKPPDIKNYRIGIDVSSLLYRFHGNFNDIYKFLTPILNNKLIFVFDGKSPEYKTQEILIRKQAKEISTNRLELLKKTYNETENKETKELILKRINELEKENWYLTYETVQDFKKYLYSKGLKYIKSISEADNLLIDLYYHGVIDAVLSNDMDYLVAGINIMYIPVKGNLKEINLKEILEFEELNIEQFREVSILMGIDNNRIFVCDDFSIAASFIRHYGSINMMKEKQENLFSNTIDISNIKQRYYPSKNILTYLKPDHKEVLDEFISL